MWGILSHSLWLLSSSPFPLAIFLLVFPLKPKDGQDWRKMAGTMESVGQWEMRRRWQRVHYFSPELWSFFTPTLNFICDQGNRKKTVLSRCNNWSLSPYLMLVSWAFLSSLVHSFLAFSAPCQCTCLRPTDFTVSLLQVGQGLLIHDLHKLETSGSSFLRVREQGTKKVPVASQPVSLSGGWIAFPIPLSSSAQP